MTLNLHNKNFCAQKWMWKRYAAAFNFKVWKQKNDDDKKVRNK